MADTSTIYDVSRLSGVSTATVSRTFSNPEKVRESTRRKVYEAAEMLRYSPNAIARAMARQRTDKIAYLICKKGTVVLDEFYSGICEGVIRAASRSDYQLLVSTEEDWRLMNSQSKQIEGVILGGSAQPSLVSQMQAQNIAVVLVNNRMAGFDLPCVVADEAAGAREALNHLIARGHRRIALLAGRGSNPYTMAERYCAFMESMEEHNLGGGNVKLCEADVESATEAAMELLSRPDRPSAVFCSSDIVAAGAMKAAHRLGLRLPEDLAVTGFDDSAICAVLEPDLTSVHVPRQQMGALCVERLMALLNGDKQTPKLTVVPTELRIRRST